ncbi:MAG: hypothetical protein JST75_04270 [Bacteroidetes bacterium]|nr:hypothetical protein [Bacteroidota bacterium]
MTSMPNDPERIDTIAIRLANKFLNQLFDFCNQKNYFVYVGSLAEIMDWSYEFHQQYDHKIKDWETFGTSNENIFNAVSQDEFLIAWGNHRIAKFYEQNANHPRKFITRAGAKLFVDNITK